MAVSPHEGRRANALKVHQQLKLKDGGRSSWHEWSEQLTPGQVVRKTEYVNLSLGAARSDGN